ncbi:hypothetical protein F5Y04DRAFT_280177 [Hypomontagnella monticulosa]|nr:hypothetical protein F5Y04DRAFT_280177 [Hypomontagnella monticulosa]
MAENTVHSAHRAFRTVGLRVGRRCAFVLGSLTSFSLLGLAAADELNGASSSDPTDEAATAADVESITSLFNFDRWRQRGSDIRSGTINQCFENLSQVLSNVGPIYAAENSASSGALTLLPTAGALIGTPAKELWMLYKMAPLAGVLSMMLSLGGNIVPDSSVDYERDGFTYGGIIGSNGPAPGEGVGIPVGQMDPFTFAREVERRAHKTLGSRKRSVAAIGIFCQLFWIGVIVFACWFTESGSIIVWWCQGWGWMLAWYLVVILSSLLENFALVPFTKQWTIRVSTAPNSISISKDAPMIFAPQYPEGSDATCEDGITPAPDRDAASLGLLQSGVDIKRTAVEEIRNYGPTVSDRGRIEFLRNLENHGFNTVGQVRIDQPWAASRQSFLVVLSMAGVTHSHAALRVCSKAISVGVFAAGTATFASASLITMSVALTTLCLVLAAGVFGRVASMWMVSEMMKEHPVIHRVVRKEEEADEFMYEILNTEGLTFELLGHVFINRRCIKRYNRWFNWSSVFGILVSPFNLRKLALGS